jgi:hypothetical protein
MTNFRFNLEQREPHKFKTRDRQIKIMDLPLHQPTVWELLPHSALIRPHRPVVDWVQSQGMACRVVAVYESVQWPVPLYGNPYASDMTLCVELAGDHDAAHFRQQFLDLDALRELEVAA